MIPNQAVSVAALLLLFAASAAATPDTYALHQINSTHWNFESTQYDLAEGDYTYQAFANTNNSDYMTLKVDLSTMLLPLGWSLIGWTDSTDRTAHYLGGLIGGNCTHVTELNHTTGLYISHNMAAPDEDNFAIERGWGYFVRVSAETLWERT